MKVTIINKTTEVEKGTILDPKEVRESLCTIAGKAAGICYMPDDYLSEGIQNEVKAKNRAKKNANSGHYSVYEHGSVSFIIETNKAMAMILNSLRLYSTSEKSARYTVMKPETELEQELYTKWKDIFVKLITPYYEMVRSETEINKLAMENARYLISVFTPTVMEYTVPFNRAILMCGWLDDISERLTFIHNNCIDNDNSIVRNYNNLYSKISDNCAELASLIRAAIGITIEDPILRDHKDIGIEFFRTLNMVNKYMHIGSCENLRKVDIDELADSIKEVYADNYVSKYKASFACVAQMQRHRTLHLTVNIPKKLECYVPKIIRGSRYEDEWKKDFDSLIKADIIPQATLLDVVERGRFEDFILKCKERLCNRAQLETMENTRDQVIKFALNRQDLSFINNYILSNIAKVHKEDESGEYKSYKERVEVLARCQFKGYICNEPCHLATSKINYYRNI